MPGNNRTTNMGGTIRRKRKQRNMTQLELADKMGVRQSTISQIELGQISPEDDLLVKISHTLDAPEILIESCYSCPKRLYIFRQIFPELDETRTPPVVLIIRLIRRQVDEIAKLTEFVSQLRRQSGLYRTKYMELYQKEKDLQSMCQVLELITTKTAGINISETDI